MALVEIQLNRLGINSLEIGATEAEVSAGAVLHVRLMNYGAPTHITIKADSTAPQFTLFTYENIYLEAESDISVPIKLSAPSGSFGITVISGYGLHKENITINVQKMEEPEPAPIAIADMGDADFDKPSKKKANKSPSPGARTARRVILTLIMPVIALAIILLWVFLYPGLSPVMIVAVTYVVMLAGIAIAWVSAR